MPPFGGEDNGDEREGKKKKERSTVPLETSYMNTQREFPLSVYQTIANTGIARAMPCQQLNVILLIYLSKRAFSGTGDWI